MTKTSFDLSDHAAVGRVGKLLQKWVEDPKTIPATPEDALAEIQGTGIGTAALERVHVHKNTETDFHISLPTADQLKEVLQDINSYLLPDPYKDFAAAPDQFDRKEFYQYRMGDYTLQHCR